MHASTTVSRGALAPLLLGLLLTLTACGGGGGGSTPTSQANPSGTSTLGASGGSTAATGGAALASGGSTAAASGGSVSTPSAGGTTAAPASEVRYSLGPISVASTTTENYQDFGGMELTPDGGWRIVWFTALFDSTGTNVVRTWYEQRFDGLGQRVGGETQLAAAPPAISNDFVVPALGGGTVGLAYEFPDGQHPILLLEHRAADGSLADPQVQVGGASRGWVRAALRLPNDSVAIAFQSVSSVGTGELYTALVTPGPR